MGAKACCKENEADEVPDDEVPDDAVMCPGKDQGAYCDCSNDCNAPWLGYCDCDEAKACCAKAADTLPSRAVLCPGMAGEDYCDCSGDCFGGDFCSCAEAKACCKENEADEVPDDEVPD